MRPQNGVLKILTKVEPRGDQVCFVCLFVCLFVFFFFVEK
jgi:hypothetical protein